VASSLFLALLAAWQLSEGSNVFHEPVGSGGLFWASTWGCSTSARRRQGNWDVRVEILISDFEKITLEDKIRFSR
jgi:hypothetical protein